MKRIIIFILAIAGAGGSLSAGPLEKIAGKISMGARKVEDHRAAVLPFPFYDGWKSKGPAVISARFTAILAGQKALDIVDPALVENSLKSLNLESSSPLDWESARKIARDLGVSTVVSGTLIDSNEKEVEVVARLISVESADVLVQADGPVPRVWEEDEPSLNAIREDHSEVEIQPPHEDVADAWPGFSDFPPDLFISESGFTPETVQTDFGEEFIEGIKLIRNGNSGAAETRFSKMHEQFKDNPRMDALISLGTSMSLFDRGRKDQAFKIAEKTAREDRFPKTRTVANYVLGKYHESADENSQAERHYLEVVRNAPFSTVLVRSAGQRLSYIRSGRQERRALRAVKKELRKQYPR